MILDNVTVWAEFKKPQLASDDATPGEMMTACTSGLPVDWTYDTNIEGLTVSVTSGNEDGSLDDLEREGEGGSIEFWSNCYGKGADGIWDNNDVPDGRVDCYGSMQVHHTEGTILAFNAWSYNLKTEMGVGNCPTGNACRKFIENKLANFSIMAISAPIARLFEQCDAHCLPSWQA